MVSTYRSTDVAVKQLKNVSLFSPELREFVAEAVLMAELRPHKNVVQFLGKSKSPVFFKKKNQKHNHISFFFWIIKILKKQTKTKQTNQNKIKTKQNKNKTKQNNKNKTKQNKNKNKTTKQNKNKTKQNKIKTKQQKQNKTKQKTNNSF